MRTEVAAVTGCVVGVAVGGGDVGVCVGAPVGTGVGVEGAGVIGGAGETSLGAHPANKPAAMSSRKRRRESARGCDVVFLRYCVSGIVLFLSDITLSDSTYLTTNQSSYPGVGQIPRSRSGRSPDRTRQRLGLQRRGCRCRCGLRRRRLISCRVWTMARLQASSTSPGASMAYKSKMTPKVTSKTRLVLLDWVTALSSTNIDAARAMAIPTLAMPSIW